MPTLSSKVDHFLDFISSPTFLLDIAYGTKTVKLSSGETEIPNVVRTVVASRLIQLYQSYCKEYGFAPLGQSSLFNRATRVSIECRKTKTKVNTLANQKGRRQSSKPIKTRSNFT